MRSLALTLSLALAGGHLHAQPARTAAPPTTVTIGGSTVLIPAPPDAADPQKLVPELRKMAELATAPPNRLLVSFVVDGDLQQILKGREIPIERYFMAQTPRHAEKDIMTRRDFDTVRAVVREQQVEMLKSVKPDVSKWLEETSKGISGEAGRPINLSLGEFVPLGILADQEAMILFGILSQLSVGRGGTSESKMIVNVSAIVHAREKVVFLYTYSLYRGEADIEWAKQVTREWAERFLKANR